MFRKLVSNIRFSPALVGQLAFYANRLRKEEVTRRAGLVFIALALVVQSFAVFQAPQSANAANSSDMVYGGLGTGSSRSLDNFLRPYDANTNDLRSIMDYVGITREEITQAQYSSWNTQGKLSWGLEPRFSYAQGERAVDIINLYGDPIRTVYARPMTLANGNDTIYGWVGHSARAGWFAIMQSCGNLVTEHVPPPFTPVTPPEPAKPVASCTALTATVSSRTSVKLTAKANVQNGATISEYRYTIKDSKGKTVVTKNVKSTDMQNSLVENITTDGAYSATVTVVTSEGNKTDANCATQFTIAPPEKCPLNPNLPVDDKECQPCPADSTIWVKDEDCAAKIVRIKTGTNMTTQKPATDAAAKTNEEIKFTITAKNEGKAPADIELTDNLTDALEYASLKDNGGGTFDEKAKTLSWGKVTLKPGEEVTKNFTIKLAATIPATAKGESEAASFDCKIVNVFGNSVSVPVDCPPVKTVEQTVTQLPKTGPTENIIFGSIVFAIAAYFYARSRQLKKEVRLVRRSLTTGAL